MTQNNCLHYWDLCPILTIDAVVALWCDVEPAQLASLNYSTSCMDVKRVLIEQALRDNLLEHEISDIKESSGWITSSPSVDEALIKNKNGIRIKKDSLRRWFESMPITDRPAFLFDESRNITPDGGEVAEMNTNKALAIMAWLLAEDKSNYKTGNKPNASAIKDAIVARAMDCGLGADNLTSFEKKISSALKLFEKNDLMPF